MFLFRFVVWLHFSSQEIHTWKKALLSQELFTSAASLLCLSIFHMFVHSVLAEEKVCLKENARPGCFHGLHGNRRFLFIYWYKYYIVHHWENICSGKIWMITLWRGNCYFMKMLQYVSVYIKTQFFFCYHHNYQILNYSINISLQKNPVGYSNLRKKISGWCSVIYMNLVLKFFEFDINIILKFVRDILRYGKFLHYFSG